MIAVHLDREQLHQVIEGIGLRIERMQSPEWRGHYDPEELEAARTALDVLTAAAHEAQQPTSAPGMG